MPPTCVWAGTPVALLTCICFSVSLHDPPLLASVRISVLVGHWIEGHLHVPKVFWQRRQWHPTPVLLPGKSHGRRSLVGCSPWGREESDTTECLHFHFSLSCIGEGNGNPLQCSCWRIPGTGEPGGLPSMGLHRVGHDWSDLAAAAGVLGLGKTLRKTELQGEEMFKVCPRI